MLGAGVGTLRKKWCITKKCETLQKTGTRNPQTGTRNKNQCYCRPRIQVCPVRNLPRQTLLHHPAFYGRKFQADKKRSSQTIFLFGSLKEVNLPKFRFGFRQTCFVSYSRGSIFTTVSWSYFLSCGTQWLDPILNGNEFIDGE